MFMKLDSDLEDLTKEFVDADVRMRRSVWETIKWHFQQLVFDIKDAMPVDTGRSKAGWGIYTSNDLASSPYQALNKSQLLRWNKRRAESEAADAVWIEDEESLSIIEGTNVPEVEYLENGHSRQAPAGFIERLTYVRLIMLGNELGELMDKVLRREPLSHS